MPSKILSGKVTTTTEAVHCSASSDNATALEVEPSNVSKNVQSSDDSAENTFKENYEAEVSQFPSPIPVPVQSDVLSTSEEVSSKMCVHKCKSPCATCVSTENKATKAGVKRHYGTSRVKVQPSRCSRRLQKKEDLCKMITVDRSRDLTMAEIEKHYPDIFICKSKVHIEREKITDTMVEEALQYISLKRMKDGYNPEEDTDSKEDKIYRNIKEQDKNKQKDERKLEDHSPAHDKKLTPALHNGRKRRKRKQNVAFKTPEKMQNESAEAGHTSHSDDVAISETPPNKLSFEVK